MVADTADARGPEVPPPTPPPPGRICCKRSSPADSGLLLPPVVCGAGTRDVPPQHATLSAQQSPEACVRRRGQEEACSVGGYPLQISIACLHVVLRRRGGLH